MSNDTNIKSRSTVAPADLSEQRKNLAGPSAVFILSETAPNNKRGESETLAKVYRILINAGVLADAKEGM